MSKIFTGKTVDDAVNEGLKELGLKAEDVEILVIEQGSKGFFGLGAKDARVQLIVKDKKQESVSETDSAPAKEKKKQPAKQKQAVKEEKTEQKTFTTPIEKGSADAENAKAFLLGLIKMLGVEGTAQLTEENAEKVVFNIETEDSSSVIGYRGEVLDSLQTLVGAVYNTDKEKYLRVVVDCEGYRAKREKTLVSLAKKLAQKAVATGRKVTLEPMNPYERRIIHSALMDYEGVKTVSEGKEPNRFVAIVPDGYDPTKARRQNRYGGKDKGGRPSSKGSAPV